MDNIAVWILFLIVGFSIVIAAYKFFGPTGLYALIAMTIVIANIQVMKLIEMFGIALTLGNILYGTIFLSTDILSEFHGKKAARKAVWIGLFALIASTIYMQITLLYTPAADDFVHEHLAAIFGFFPRIVLASIIAYVISQHLDIWLYTTLKEKFKGRHLWLRNNLSTMTSQFVDSLLFATIAFYGVFSWDIFIQIVITTYIIKFVVAGLDTPFMYLVKRWIAKKTY